MQLTNRKNAFQLMALCFMYIYITFCYVGYISPIFMTVLQLSLYAFIGLSLVSALSKGKVYMNFYLIGYGMFFAFALFSCLYAEKKTVAFNYMYTLFTSYMICFCTSLIIRDKNDMESVFNAIVIGSVLLMIYLIKTNLIVTMVDEQGRFGEELTGNANIFGLLYMIAASVSVYFLFSNSSIKCKIVYAVALFLQLYALTASGGRKYMVFPLMIFFIMLIQNKDKHNKKHIILYSFISIVAIGGIYYLFMNNEFLYENIGYRFEDLINYTTGESSKAEGGTIVREKMIIAAKDLWLQSPLFGHGTHMFSVISGFNVYSHNNFMELLCNNGIIGFCIYYGIYALIIFKLIKCPYSVLRNYFIAFVISMLANEIGAITYNSSLVQVILLLSCRYLSNNYVKEC